MPDWATTAFFKANASGWLGQVARMHDKMTGFLNATGKAAQGAFPHLHKFFTESIAGQVAIGNLVSRGIGRGADLIKDMVKSVPEFAERADQIGRTALIVGTSAERWQRLAYAAKMTDTSTEGLQAAMQKLNKNMADLTVGKGTLMDIVRFGPKGLGQMIRSTHDTTEALMLLADAFKKTTDPQVRARMATAAFGKAGQELIPMLSEGREGLIRYMEAARDVIPDRTILAGEKFAATWKKTTATLNEIKDRVLGQLLERFQPFLDRFLAWVDANKDLINRRIDTTLNTIASALQMVVGAWQSLQTLTGGNAVKDIFLLVGAWKALTIAITAANAAKALFGNGSPGGSLGGMAGKLLGGGGAAAGGASALGGVAALAIPLAAGAGLMAATSWATKERMAHPTDVTRAQDAANPYLFMQRQGSFGMAPNAGAPNVNVPLTVNVDNTRAPGTNSAVSVAPPLTGARGMQFGFAGAQ